MKRALSIGFGVALAALCLWLFFRGVDEQQLWRRVVNANPALLAALVATSILHLALRAARWRTLLGPAGRRVPFGELFSAVSIGYMASILPGRVGEVIRPTALSRRTGIPFGVTLATVAAERVVLDLPVLVLFGALFLALPPSITGLAPTADPQLLAWVRSSGVLLLVASLAGLAIVAILGRRQQQIAAKIQAWADRRTSGFPRRVCGWFNSLLPGLTTFGTFGGLARLAAETLAIWIVIAAGIYCGVVACGVSVSPAAMLIVIPATAAGIAVPTPGGAGTYHMAMKMTLVGLFGADDAAAVSAGLVGHGLPLAVVLAMGGWFAIRGGLARGVRPVPVGAEEGEP